MRKNSIAILFTLISFVVFSKSIAQDIKLTNYITNTNPKIFKKIFIVGAGTIASRVFLENLSSKLIENLKKKGIDAEYSYLGKTEKDIILDFKNLQTKGFDAIFFFNPTGTSKTKIGAKSLDSIPGHTGAKIASLILFGNTASTYKYFVNYMEIFNISIFDITNTSNPIWEAFLGVDGNFSKKKMYKKITEKIILNMTNNFLVPKKNN